MESNAGRDHKIAPRLSLVGIFLGMCLLYAWIASPDFSDYKAWGSKSDYYNLLIDGFRTGKLSLSIDPPRELSQLKDPYDPAQNAGHGLHDISYYKGKYYLYFGITPAVTLFLPARVIGGRYLSDVQVTVIFSCLGLGAALWSAYLIRGQYFREAPDSRLVMCALALGLCTMIPSFLSRASIWEVPISSAYCFFMATCAFLLKSRESKRPLLWLGAASLAYGLVVGSRPSYALGAVMVLVPLLGNWFHDSVSALPPRERPGFRPMAIALLLPIGLVACALMAYNYGRFGNPAEFGMRYQLTGGNEAKNVHFSLSYLWYNARVYLIEPCRLSVYFPFVKIIDAPKPPAGYISIEDPYGILTNIPFALSIVGLAFLPGRQSGLTPIVRAMGIGLVATLLTILCFAAASNRYMIDFLPAWMLLGCIGYLVVDSRLRGAGRSIFCLLAGAALAVSCAFNLFAAWTHNDLFRRNHPEAYRPLAHAFDRSSQALRALYGTHQGPMELTLMLPKDKTGKMEPLMVSGVGFMSDYLYLYYPTPSTLVVGVEHTNYGGPATAGIPMDYSLPHTITVEAGFLYPPLEDPFFDKLKREEAIMFRRRLRIAIDGTTYILDSIDSYDPYRFHPLIGRTTDDRRAFGAAFTGTVLSKRYVPAAPEPSHSVSVGRLVMGLRLPSFTAPHSEPLLCSGVTGKADLIFITYIDAGHISIGLDHWGVGGSTTGPLAIDLSQRHVIELGAGFLYPAERRPPSMPVEEWNRLAHMLLVSVDGSRVLEVRQDFYRSILAEVRIGENFVGASTSVERFSGMILDQKSVVGAP